MKKKQIRKQTIKNHVINEHPLMKKILLSIPPLFIALPVLAHADEEINYGWQGMMGNWGGSMMGGQFFGIFGFLFPLLMFAFWGLTIALLVALVRWVWKKGDGKK